MTGCLQPHSVPGHDGSGNYDGMLAFALRLLAPLGCLLAVVAAKYCLAGKRIDLFGHKTQEQMSSPSTRQNPHVLSSRPVHSTADMRVHMGRKL